MRNYTVFLKKEIFEYTKTYKLLIMLMVFAVFGITNPLMAKLLPEILGSLMADSISMSLPEATAFDAWTQFFKNATQMGLIVTVILFSGVLSSELSTGTLINMLTKGLSRTVVILSKYTCMVLVWTISIALCFGLTYGYTVYLFPGDKTANLLFSTFCLWLFGLFLLAILLLAATLTKSNYGCLLITGAAVVICMLVNIMPAAHEYNPISLVTDNLGLITNSIEAASLYGTILISCLLSLLFVLLSVLIFRKKQL
ncbi:ABC transporter permease [Faecalicatena contorta]|uniref:ABC-2 type transport system permease protein n=1 Tax=Faecalicatena contorta TaxID=39482 RepID=A0A316A3K7_9FIRM|nr:ABC transporter permease [Faecalicatena contorta]PWJ51334.1 ABC-2 type transport system permease protein [Faecalicatena contorta]SUQ12890.1 ABC-2 type transport system permease protein [Faecalicatena contorta]